MARFQVIVGNVGTVYDGQSKREAELCYATYVDRSKSGHGRCAGESVVLMAGQEIAKEHVGTVGE